MSAERLETIIPPFSFTLDGALVTIYEIPKSELISGDKWYHVYLDIEWRGKRSRRFTLDVKGWEDLLRKLLVEISKFKLMVLMGVEV
ncbi:MAG: hypothetical protein DRJ96_09075 [Thermoprotei archaeon]|nr:MAG: hypothetical protein DRJ96_09075 [Thermoprotei archaeon]